MALLETVAGEFFKRFFEWISFKKKRKISEIMTDSVDVRELAKAVVQNGHLCIYMCYLLNAYNGRRQTKGHRFKYRKFVSGYHDKMLFQHFDVMAYRKVPVDDEYSNLLDRILHEKSVFLSVWSMQSGWLRSAFIYEGINQAGFYLVDDDNENHEMWYLLCATKSNIETDLQTPEHQYIIKRMIGDLKNMIDAQRK